MTEAEYLGPAARGVLDELSEILRADGAELWVRAASNASNYS